MNIGVILAAGDSSRFGGTVNKQYLKLNGKEVVGYAIESMQNSNCDDVLLVLDNEEFEKGYISEKYNVKSLVGGNTRNESIDAALQYIDKNYADCKNVIFHDSVRPLVRSEMFNDMITLLKNNDAVVYGDTISDALTFLNFQHVDRKDFRMIVSPEGFKFDQLKSNFNKASDNLAIISHLPADVKVHVVKSDFYNYKITFPEDLFIAEHLSRVNFLSVKHDDFKFKGKKDIGKVLLLGGSGGLGQALVSYFIENEIHYLAPKHSELDLENLTDEKLNMYLNGFVPDAIINAAAVYFDDSNGIVETFDKIFNVNLKSSLVLIGYAEKIQKKVNVVLLSSSSSTKGRENLTNYSAAKSALNSAVESLGKKMMLKDVYINAVIPEKVNTPLIEKLHKKSINKRELLEPSEIIDVIMYFAVCDDGGKLVHIRKGL